MQAKKREGNTCCASILVRFFHKILGAQNGVYSSSTKFPLEAYNKLTRFQHVGKKNKFKVYSKWEASREIFFKTLLVE